MPRLLKLVVPVALISCVAVGSRIAWSNSVSLAGVQALETQDVTTPTSTKKFNLDLTVLHRTVKADREIVPAAPLKVDFNQTFADAVATPRRDNTPTNREKLRNAGWNLITRSL